MKAKSQDLTRWRILLAKRRSLSLSYHGNLGLTLRSHYAIFREPHHSQRVSRAHARLCPRVSCSSAATDAADTL
eukprot:scaffold34008_cov135-Skeletonema_marinoi.AAC.1